MPEEGGTDTKRGWVVVTAAFIVSFLSIGTVSCFGILLVALVEKFRQSRASTALVGSLMNGIARLVGYASTYIAFSRPNLVAVCCVCGASCMYYFLSYKMLALGRNPSYPRVNFGHNANLLANGEALTYSLSLEPPQDGTRPLFAERSRGRPEIPDWVHASLTVESLGHVSLQMTRQRLMGLPARAMTSHDVTRVDKTEYDNKDMFFYTDTVGKGSVLFELKRNNDTGKLYYESWALATVGRYSCYVSPGADKADCMKKPSRHHNCRGQLTGVPTSTVAADTTAHDEGTITADLPSVVGKTATPPDYTLPKPGHKTVEVVFVVDAKYMEMFYERHPGAPDLAQREVQVYMGLLANEMNTFFDSFRDMSAGKFELFVYPAAVMMPEYGEDFRWSSNFNDGKILTATGEMNTELWKFVEKVLRDKPTDHVMAFTGYKLHQVNGPALGFAYMSTVCTKITWKYSMVEFRNVDPSATAAHELGHALGAGHDEDVGCKPSNNVMTGVTYAPDADTRDAYFRFSRCSRLDIKAHLNKQPGCTLDNSFTNAQFAEMFCAGFLGNQDNSLDTQCQRKTGFTGSKACNAVKDDAGCYSYGSVTCRDREGRCKAKLAFVWNGTPCGRDMACFKGRCVPEFDICPGVPGEVTPPCTCCKLSTTTRGRCCIRAMRKHGHTCRCCGDLRNVPSSSDIA